MMENLVKNFKLFHFDSSLIDKQGTFGSYFHRLSSLI
jgi:hypothetical protein